MFEIDRKRHDEQVKKQLDEIEIKRKRTVIESEKRRSDVGMS
jgi:hypothetical protein